MFLPMRGEEFPYDAAISASRVFRKGFVIEVVHQAVIKLLPSFAGGRGTTRMLDLFAYQETPPEFSLFQMQNS